jgi:antitoxin (DNA-binding transcriptional repressor) of toxin-antitoxin stability system
MRKIDKREAKPQLSRLADPVVTGREEGVTIAMEGEPQVKIVPLTPRDSRVRIGIARGVFVIPETIDRENDAIAKLFDGEDA